ncbi:MAG: protein phosphatase 2C domain-containing protein, partial [Acidimicrobiaceae bacterium]|nr:protein phosphatase 2C domain-containing protein [Acidimicrobiaceae bacterium]
RALAGLGGGANAVDTAVGAANEAARAAAEMEAGATTLAVAAISAGGEAVAGRVGDSDARVLRCGAWEAVFDSEPDASDPIVATVTDALPADAPQVDAASVTLAGGDVLVLLTDGLAQPLDDGPTTVAPTLAAALSTPVGPLALAGLIDFSRQGCHDDRTIVAAWMRDG